MRLLSPRILLHGEGAAMLALACYGYSQTGRSWGWFFGLLLAPDLSAVGYAIGPKSGAFTYNLAHTYLAPVVVVAVFLALHRLDLVWLLLIWVAHIGLDRMVGYGLKYPTHFKETHLNRV